MTAFPSGRAGLRAALSAAVAALSLGAAHAAEVNVYTERQPVFLDGIFEAFERESGIDVNVLYLDKGALERLRSEGEHSPADAVIVADIGRLSQLSEGEVVRPVRSAAVDKAVPAGLRHPDGNWVALSRRFRLLFAHRDADPASLPRDYSELGSPDLGGSVCIRSGSHPYNVALFAAYLEHSGEAATAEWLRGLKGNLARKPQGNDRAQIKGVASGACDFAVANLYYYFKMLGGSDAGERAVAERVRWVPVTVAGKGVHTNVSGIAVARHARNVAEATRLVEFMVGETAQRMYAFNNGELPVRAGVTMPSGLEEANRTRADGLSLQRIAAGRGRASELVELVAFDD